MKTKTNQEISYSGMMYANDFKQWYTYLKRRLDNEWSTEDISFLLGKPSYYYADFEKMYKVADFLKRESMLLDRIYRTFHTETMEFYTHKFEVPEERIVRLCIQEEMLWKNYSISIPWEFASGKNKPPAALLFFEEWKRDEDIQIESDVLLHVRLELEKLLKLNFFKVRQSALEIFERIQKTELLHHKILPRHIKKGIYLLIQQGKIVVRNNGDRYCFCEIF